MYNRNNLRTIVLDRCFIYVREIVKVGMIVVYICYCREIQAGYFILHYSKVGIVRHELVHNSCQRVCEWVFCCRLIQIHKFLISCRCLKQQCRSIRTTRFNVYHQTNIIEFLTVLLPHSLHTHHCNLFGISKQHFDSLFPFLPIFQGKIDSFKYDSNSITIVSRTVRPHRISFCKRL